MQLLIHITNHEDSVDAPAIVGGLRRFINPGRQTNKMVLLVLKVEEVSQAIEIIHGVSGDLKKPNTGILGAALIYEIAEPLSAKAALQRAGEIHGKQKKPGMSRFR